MDRLHFLQVIHWKLLSFSRICVYHQHTVKGIRHERTVYLHKADWQLHQQATFAVNSYNSSCANDPSLKEVTGLSII